MAARISSGLATSTAAGAAADAAAGAAAPFAAAGASGGGAGGSSGGGAEAAGLGLAVRPVVCSAVCNWALITLVDIMLICSSQQCTRSRIAQAAAQPWGNLVLPTTELGACLRLRPAPSPGGTAAAGSSRGGGPPSRGGGPLGGARAGGPPESLMSVGRADGKTQLAGPLPQGSIPRGEVHKVQLNPDTLSPASAP